VCYYLALALGARVMTEEPKSFTVKDRRHFTAEGDAREPDEAPPTEEKPVEAKAEVPPPAEPPKPQEPSGAPETGPGRDARPEGEGPVTFDQFLLSLGAQASMLLAGQLETETPREALSEARSMIGILEMLKDKTEGRRTPREDQVLEGLLYELRMAYVARAREVGE
jgi:Domain of unknown function (DUF1844)